MTEPLQLTIDGREEPRTAPTPARSAPAPTAPARLFDAPTTIPGSLHLETDAAHERSEDLTAPAGVAITTNPHDDGYDLVAGPDITGRVIGSIYIGSDEPGLWMDLHGDGFAIDDAQHAARIIREETGRTLTAESIDDIASLAS